MNIFSDMFNRLFTDNAIHQIDDEVAANSIGVADGESVSQLNLYNYNSFFKRG